jgi:hypothetical protein
MSLQYNVQDNHPIIPNANEYLLEKKYVSIHSVDRDVKKFPISTEFELELPEDYLNVQSLQLHSWNFPTNNLYTFSKINNNVSMIFSIFPCLVDIADTNYDYYEQLYNYLIIDHTFIIQIEDGNYSADELSTELTNRFNNAVTQYLYDYFREQNLLHIYKPYNEFVIVYNKISQKIWFGNKSNSFTLHNDDTSIHYQHLCITKNVLPEYENWGLPFNLGFTRKSETSIEGTEEVRFYYGNVINNDNGKWLIKNPDLKNAVCHYIESPIKINLQGANCFYIELDKQNYIDETSPYTLNKFTQTTNITNGEVNSSFAVIYFNNLSQDYQWYNNNTQPVKYYNPPAERIRKFKFRIRYHNGLLVDFGNTEFSFMIELNLLRPQNKTGYYVSKF